MKTLLIILSLSCLAFSLEMHEFVQKALRTNPDIMALSKELDKAAIDEELAGKLDNPTLGVAVTNILENKPFKRDFDPSQRVDFSLTQMIPTDGKLSKRVSLQKFKTAQLKEQIRQKSLQLEYELYAELYNLSSLKVKKKLYEKYLKNYELLLTLLNSYNASGTGSHIASIKAEIEMQNIRNELFDIEAKIKISTSKVNTLNNNQAIEIPNIALEFAQIDFAKTDITKSPQIKEKLFALSASDEAIRLENSSKYPDIGLTIGYSSADSSFKNFFFFGVTIPLPIYGREQLSIKKASEIKLQQENELTSQNNEIKYEVEDMKARYEGLSKSYALINRLSQKTTNHSLETIFAGIQSSKASAENAVGVLNEIVGLEIKTVDIIRESAQIKANLKRVTGEEL